ncbi:hypothetical protein [Photorhabdus laumondii]|uniref:hypothetical protein n=1 Tax=Photorhabdus laumondii TaxID=2218628 RepID=UPI0010578DF2|nr:hypothetical protein [Photorhabdus laumondii]
MSNVEPTYVTLGATTERLAAEICMAGGYMDSKGGKWLIKLIVEYLRFQNSATSYTTHNSMYNNGLKKAMCSIITKRYLFNGILILIVSLYQ